MQYKKYCCLTLEMKNKVKIVIYNFSVFIIVDTILT